MRCPGATRREQLRARMRLCGSGCPSSACRMCPMLRCWPRSRHGLRRTCSGVHRLDALGAETLSQALASLFDYEQRRLLDAQAPESLLVPSGQRRRLDYSRGELRRCWRSSCRNCSDWPIRPRSVAGSIPVTLHLLSPAGRPIQVTQDLKGFWERTYPEVKKELKGRYPRHPWPDDPWTATPDRTGPGHAPRH